MANRALRDEIGQRGEAIFYVLLTRFYDRNTLIFRPQFLGDKWPAVDYIVELRGHSPTLTPYFFVQVRATRQGYTQKNNRLKIGFSQSDAHKLAALPAPTYLVGIDEIDEKGYIIAVGQARSSGLSSMSTQFPLNQETQELLWQEVSNYWTKVAPFDLNSKFVDPEWR